ncbi:MAG: hypothetical protein V3U19_03680 [Thermodesulfobacteriota bacterium]
MKLSGHIKRLGVGQYNVRLNTNAKTGKDLGTYKTRRLATQRIIDHVADQWYTLSYLSGGWVCKKTAKLNNVPVQR